jgi:hypothetical protein
MEIGFIKSYYAAPVGSYTRAKRRHADALRMVLIKFLDKNSLKFNKVVLSDFEFKQFKP